MKHIAVAIKDDYWVLLSKPCSFSSAELFKDCICNGETFAIKTVEEVENYKKVLM